MINQTKRVHPQELSDLFWAGCCIALRTGRFRRLMAIELPAVTTLSRHFPQKFSSKRSLAGPAKLPSLSRRTQIPPSTYLSPNSFSWVCSACSITCTTGAVGGRDFFLFFFPVVGGDEKKYPPGSIAWPEQQPELKPVGGGQGGTITRRAKEFYPSSYIRI